LTVESPEPKKPITVRVEEVLYGMSAKAVTVAVPYDDPDHGDLRDGLGSPAATWRGIKVSANLPVMVVLGLERGFGVYPGEAVVITSDEREMGIIRSLVGSALRFRESQEAVATAVTSLSLFRDAPMAGYLSMYLTMGKAQSPIDVTAALLGELLANPSVPAARADWIADFLVLDYRALSEGGKAGLVRRFADLGQGSDMALARAAFTGLARIAGFDRSVAAMIPEPVLNGLKSAYRESVAKGRVPRDEALERGLGINGQ
jgi:hypothetical protein